MAKRNSVVERIDIDMHELMKKFAKKNNMSKVQASKELARISKMKLQTKKLMKEIKF